MPPERMLPTSAGPQPMLPTSAGPQPMPPTSAGPQPSSAYEDTHDQERAL